MGDGLYAGLRRGELRALRWRNVEGLFTEERVRIRVEASWDDYAGEVEPKSMKGTRWVPAPEILRPYLEDHATRRISAGLVRRLVRRGRNQPRTAW